MGSLTGHLREDSVLVLCAGSAPYIAHPGHRIAHVLLGEIQLCKFCSHERVAARLHADGELRMIRAAIAG